MIEKRGMRGKRLRQNVENGRRRISMSDTDAAAARAALDRLDRFNPADAVTISDYLTALEAEVAALRQDAGRMDYLQLHQSVRTRDAKGRHWWRVSAWSSGAPTLRAAIDDLRAALSSSAPTPGGSNE